MKGSEGAGVVRLKKVFRHEPAQAAFASAVLTYIGEGPEIAYFDSLETSRKLRCKDLNIRASKV